MTDTKALRGLLEKVKLENWYFRECNADGGYVIVNAEGTPCGKVFDYKTNVILGNVVKALPDILDAYEERDRLRATLALISSMCPPVKLHECEGNYDFGPADFNTPDEYSDYMESKALSNIGDVARFALEPKQ